MAGIFIGSTKPSAGKSMLSVALGVLLQQKGHSVGFMKPVGQYLQKIEEKNGDADALVIQEALGQCVDADILSPLMLPDSLHALHGGVDEKGGGYLEKITSAYKQIAAGKDCTIVAGTASFPSTGSYCGVDGLTLVRALDLKCIIIERFTGQFPYDAILHLKGILGDSLLGLVMNDIPEKHLRDINNILRPFLSARGIPLLGVIPPAPALSAMRASDLAYSLSGYIAAGSSKASRMVEGYIIGTMQVDNFMTFLRHKKRTAAVIVGGDRADLQVAALHAESPSLVLTGNISPCELVRKLAEEKGVPIICVREDTFTTARKMALLIRSKKMRDLHQIRLAVSIVSESLDLDPITDIL